MKKRVLSSVLASVLVCAAAVPAHAANYVFGGDITQINYIEDLGGKFFDTDGAQTDPIEFLADSGLNTVRIRLSNNPGKGRGDGTFYMPEGYQNEEDCLKTARRAAALGLDIAWTFNYSDYWSNGERQIIPSDWVNAIKEDLGFDVRSLEFLSAMTDEEMKAVQDKLGDLVYSYTLDISKKLKAQGTEPKYVSLGNEIRGGIFFPFANTYETEFDPASGALLTEGSDKTMKCKADWDALTAVLNRGYDAVKEIFPSAAVVIHVDDGSNYGSCEWFFDEYIKAGGKLDVLGVSYYPAWSQNTADVCAEFCTRMKERFGMDVLLMETGFNWNSVRKDGFAGQLVDIDAYKGICDPTPDGQRDFMSSLMTQTKETGACLGFLYWDPVMIHVEDENGTSVAGWAYRESDDGVEPNVVENSAWFDFDGKALPVTGLISELAPKKTYFSPIYEDSVLSGCTVAEKFYSGAEYLFDGCEIKRLQK